MLTAYGSVETAVRAVPSAPTVSTPSPGTTTARPRHRADDHRRRLETENARLRQELRDRYSANIVGRAAHAGGLPARQRSPQRSTVLITGERHRQGADRQGRARQFAARRRPVHPRQLRLHPGRSARVRPVRAHQGRLHRRGGQPQGILRGRQWRHALPRRDRHADAGNPGEAAARAAGARADAGRLQRDHPRRRAHSRGDSRGSGNAGRQRRVSRGPLLPPQRHRRPAAAPARAYRRHPLLVRTSSTASAAKTRSSSTPPATPCCTSAPTPWRC